MKMIADEEKDCFYNFDKELEPKPVTTSMEEHKKIEQSIEVLDKKLEHLDEKLKGLDRSLDASFNAAWIEKYLKCLFPDADVQFNKMFKDLTEIVNQQAELFEVDVFVQYPLIIGEATNFFTEDDFKKLDKLFRIRIYFKREKNINIDKVYFFTYDIDESLEHKVRKYCTENDIIFVKEKDL